MPMAGHGVGLQLVVAQLLRGSQSAAPFGNACSQLHACVVQLASHCLKLTQAALARHALNSFEHETSSHAVQASAFVVVPEDVVVPEEVVPEDVVLPEDPADEPLALPTL